MKRLSFYVLSATATMLVSGAMPMAAQAAECTYGIQGNGFVNWSECGHFHSAGQGSHNAGIIIPGISNPNPELPGAGLPDINLPDANLPDANLPDISLPEPEFPVPDLPSVDNGGEEIPDYDDGQGDFEGDAYVRQVVELVNARRAEAGLLPLRVDSQVAKAAQTRAREIETLFEHTRPDGSNFNTALSASGVNYRGAGENIAYGQRSPEAVMQSWMNSAGHRANILNEQFTSIGVGHYRNAAGVDYWSQLFIY